MSHSSKPKWTYVKVIDLGENKKEKCHLCGNEHVRYIHVLKDQNGVKVRVGKVCAERLLHNIYLPERKEKEIRNRLARKKNFLRKWWDYDKESKTFTLNYKGKTVKIMKSHYGSNWGILINRKFIWSIDNKRFKTFDEAKEAAFDIFEESEKKQLCSRNQSKK